MSPNKTQDEFLNFTFTIPCLWEPNDKCIMGTINNRYKCLLLEMQQYMSFNIIRVIK